MYDHYEYKVYRYEPDGNETEFFGQSSLPTAEACRQHFLSRFPNNRDLRCVIRNSCGYTCVAIKDFGKVYFRHLPDTGWHTAQ